MGAYFNDVRSNITFSVTDTGQYDLYFQGLGRDKYAQFLQNSMFTFLEDFPAIIIRQNMGKVFKLFLS